MHNNSNNEDDTSAGYQQQPTTTGYQTATTYGQASTSSQSGFHSVEAMNMMGITPTTFSSNITYQVPRFLQANHPPFLDSSGAGAGASYSTGTDNYMLSYPTTSTPGAGYPVVMTPAETPDYSSMSAYSAPPQSTTAYVSFTLDHIYINNTKKQLLSLFSDAASLAYGSSTIYSLSRPS